MKTFNFMTILLILVLSCKPSPDFYKDGIGYKIEKRCIKDTTYKEWGYQYGINPVSGRTTHYYGYKTIRICLEYENDTIQITK